MWIFVAKYFIMYSEKDKDYLAIGSVYPVVTDGRLQTEDLTRFEIYCDIINIAFRRFKAEISTMIVNFGVMSLRSDFIPKRVTGFSACTVITRYVC